MRNIITSVLATLFTTTLFVGVANSQEVNFGPFSGSLNTTVSQGFQVRTEETDCKLIAGSDNTYSAALQGLIGGGANSGNGGCDAKMTSSLGESSKVIGIGSANSDDGNVNFKKGDFTDASSSLSLSYSGSTAEGIGLNFSASGLQNHVLDLNTPTFKQFSSEAKDHLEQNIKLGNAYVSLPMGNTDVTIGKYVQSQGVTALMQIGVNVVNPVSLPIIRAPGTLLKDALLPQAMIGFNTYLGQGISMEGYYQLEQSEVELDAAGAFFGSELLGVGSSSGLLNSSSPGERGSPAFSQYYNLAACAANFTGTWAALAAGNNMLTCTSAEEYANIGSGNTDGGTDIYSYHTTISTAGTGSGAATNSSNTLVEDIADGSAVAGAPLGLGSATNMASGFQTWATLGLHGALQVGSGGAIGAADSVGYANAVWGTGVQAHAITDTEYLAAYRTLAAHGTNYGFGTYSGVVDIKRAVDAKAKDDGQFGLNLSGYADDIGTGVEWGLYYNNSHSNAPRVRMLSITNGYAPHLYGHLLQQTTDALNANTGFNLERANAGAGAPVLNLLESAVAGVAFGPTLCYALIAAIDEGDIPNATHIHDSDTCYNLVRGLNPADGSDTGTNSVARFVGGAVGAMATLGYTNSARFQAYYPEDIQTFGASMATNVGSTTVNVEVAYRPDFPFQIDVADLVNNQLDSSGGSLVQSATIVAGAAASEPAVASLSAKAAAQRWSATPLCDLSSSGNASAEVAGYNYCDGTAEFDAWTLNTNFISFLSPSSPVVQEMGADSGSWLLDLGAVYVPSLDYKQGVVSANHFYSGHDVNQNGCNDTSGTSNALTFYKNALFGTNYCDDAGRAGANDFAVQAKFRGSLTYNNINNSQWNFSPSIAWDHGLSGNAPSSLGGWTEDSYQLGLGASFANQSGMSVALNYTNKLGDNMQNKSKDKDTLSASVSYSF
jgi:hypothetical protein